MLILFSFVSWGEDDDASFSSAVSLWSSPSERLLDAVSSVIDVNGSRNQSEIPGTRTSTTFRSLFEFVNVFFRTFSVRSPSKTFTRVELFLVDFSDE